MNGTLRYSSFNKNGQAFMSTQQLNYWRAQERLGISYSQAATRAVQRRNYSKRAKRQLQQELVFPPLPPGPPPPLPEEQEARDLLNGLLKQSRVNSNLSKYDNPVIPSDFDFDKTNIKTFLDWCDGKLRFLSPSIASEVGLDAWLYELRGKPPPTAEQERLLKKKIVELANVRPFRLHEAVETRTLKDLLGDGFEWVESNMDW